MDLFVGLLFGFWIGFGFEFEFVSYFWLSILRYVGLDEMK